MPDWLSEQNLADSWEDSVDLKESSFGRLYVKLSQSFDQPEQLTNWLKTPNQAFGGSQPLQVIERGEIDRSRFGPGLSAKPFQTREWFIFLESGSPS